eukprot:2711464-Amphidinium_carterae.2
MKSTVRSACTHLQSAGNRKCSYSAVTRCSNARWPPLQRLLLAQLIYGLIRHAFLLDDEGRADIKGDTEFNPQWCSCCKVLCGTCLDAMLAEGNALTCPFCRTFSHIQPRRSASAPKAQWHVRGAAQQHNGASNDQCLSLPNWPNLRLILLR